MVKPADMKRKNHRKSRLRLEIDRAEIRVADLARRLCVSRQRVQNWAGTMRTKPIRVPAEWAIKIERVTGISRGCLRPDLWDAEQ